MCQQRRALEYPPGCGHSLQISWWVSIFGNGAPVRPHGWSHGKKSQDNTLKTGLNYLMEVLWPENRGRICQAVSIVGTPFFSCHFLQYGDISSIHYIPLQSACFSKIIIFLPVLVLRLIHVVFWCFPSKLLCKYFHDTSIKTSKFKYKASQKQWARTYGKG